MSGLQGFVSPFLNPQSWDKFRVGGASGVLSPGVIPPGKIQGFKRTNEWDVKKGKGAQGGNITFVQQPPSTGSITIWVGYLTRGSTPQAQFDALDKFIPLLEYDPTKKLVPPSTGVQAAATSANAAAKAAQQAVDDYAAQIQRNPPRTAESVARAKQDLEDLRVAAATALRAAGIATATNVAVPAPLKAISIWHPSFASTKVLNVVTEDISPLLHIGKGVFEITFSFLEYRPPPAASAVSTPNFSQGGGSKGPGAVGSVPDPVGDRNDQIIAALLEQAKKP